MNNIRIITFKLLRTYATKPRNAVAGVRGKIHLTKREHDKGFEDAFVMLHVSLQNYVYIELFKLFDSNGKDSKENSIYTLINIYYKGFPFITAL